MRRPEGRFALDPPQLRVRIRMPRGLLGGEPEGVDEQDAQGLDRFVAFEASLFEEDQGFLPEPDRVRPAPRAGQEVRDACASRKRRVEPISSDSPCRQPT